MTGRLPRPFGPYCLLKLLGAGATGSVLLARPMGPDRGIPTPVVIKQLHPSLGEEEEFVRRFRHEAMIAVSVDDPHVAAVYDVGSVERILYIAMELVQGCTVARLMRALVESGRILPIAAAVEVIAGGLRGLAAVHSAVDPETGRALEVVHRDVSPRNLMIGGDARTRIIDLGLGKSNAQEWRTKTGAVMGTLGYIAPEQVLSDRVDHRADLYSIATVLFELLTMEPYVPRGDSVSMFRAMSEPVFRKPSSLRPEIPPELDRILERALAQAPDRRHGSALELLAELEPFRAHRRGEPDVKTILDQLVGAELNRDRSELEDLLRQNPFSDDDEPEIEHTTTFAQRAGVRALALDEGATVVSTGNLQSIAPTIRTRPRSQRKVPLHVAIGAVVAAVALTLGAERLLFDRDDANTPVVLEPEPKLEATAAPAEPRATPGPVAEPEPEENAPMLEPVEETEIAPRPARRPAREEPPRREARTPPASEGAAQRLPSPPSEPTADTVAKTIQILTRRAEKARRARPEDAGKIDRVLEDISIWAGSKDFARATKALQEVAARLDAIDKT